MPNECKKKGLTLFGDPVRRPIVMRNECKKKGLTLFGDSVAPFQHSDLNQYTSINGAPMSFDANFNQTTTHYGYSFVYNAQNQVAGGSMQATYDGLGRCVRRTVGGNTLLFTYDGWNPILEWDGAGNWKGWTIYGARTDEVVARYDATYGPLLYKQDNQGSVTFVMDGGNRIIEKYTYDVYGRPTVTSWDYNSGTWKAPSDRSSFGNRFMFTGREWLADVQLYDYRHRLYDPDTGRLLQKDPLGFGGGDANLFRYCGGDPVNGRDPYGLEEVTKKTEDGSDIPGSGGVSLGDQPYTSGPGLYEFPTYGNEGVTDLLTVNNGNFPGYGKYDLNRMSGPVLGGNGLGITGAGDVSAGSDGRGGGTSRFANGVSPVGGPGNTPLGNGTTASPQFSGIFTVSWWPEILTLPYAKPPTPEQAAWTDTGRVPTLIAAGIFALPVLAPETGLYASAALYNSVETATMTAIGAGIVGYQAAMANPTFINGVQQFAGGFTPGMGGATSSWYGFAGWWTGQIWRNSNKGH